MAFGGLAVQGKTDCQNSGTTPRDSDRSMQLHKARNSIYTDGSYLDRTGGTWHLEDSPFKARQIVRILARHPEIQIGVCSYTRLAIASTRTGRTWTGQAAHGIWRTRRSRQDRLSEFWHDTPRFRSEYAATQGSQ